MKHKLIAIWRIIHSPRWMVITAKGLDIKIVFDKIRVGDTQSIIEWMTQVHNDTIHQEEALKEVKKIISKNG